MALPPSHSSQCDRQTAPNFLWETAWASSCAKGLRLLVGAKTKIMGHQAHTAIFMNHNEAETVEELAYSGSSVDNQGKGITDHGVS